MAIGSPRGATCSTRICSPGTQPISMSFRKISLFSKLFITTVCPTPISDKRFIIIPSKLCCCIGIVLRILEMMENNTVNVQFNYLVKGFRFERRQDCKDYLQVLFRKEGKKLEQLNYIFCSDEYLLEMNKKHLRHNYYTDIITFGLSDPGHPNPARPWSDWSLDCAICGANLLPCEVSPDSPVPRAFEPHRGMSWAAHHYRWRCFRRIPGWVDWHWRCDSRRYTCSL